jgi:predicted O-linked N-acetylglucosamine transferase (SPINDLY family)
MPMTHATTCATLADGIHDIARVLSYGDNWPLIAPEPDARLLDGVLRAREGFCANLEHCGVDDVDAVLRSTLFLHGTAPMLTGVVQHRSTATRARMAAAIPIMQQGWSHAMARHAFAIAVLHAVPHEVPLMRDSHLVPEFVLERYLTWLFARPCFAAIGDDAAYVAWLPAMLDWVSTMLVDTRITNRALVINTVLRKLDIGMIIYSDVNIRPVLDARARLLSALTAQSESLRAASQPPTRARPATPRIRLGFLLRTVMRHPDPLAFCAQFEHFDRDRYEFILYSHDLIDRQCSHDVALYQRLFSFVSTVRSLNGRSVRDMIDAVRADDLDVFVFAYAATIGATPTDCLISTRLARVQIVMNSYVPLATGLPSFTHVATVAPAPDCAASLRSECSEALVEIPRVLISYPPAESELPERTISRATLGIPPDAPVFFNGGAVDKIVPVLAASWLRILAATPGSVLVLAPFNPGWSGTQAAATLFALLARMCREHGVERSRVIVLRELSPRDTHQILRFSTAYLGTFPHGSSTSIALALQAGVPVIARRSPWLRGTGDASLANSIGLHELVAADADEYVRIAVRLGSDHTWHQQLQHRINAALPTAPFLSSPEYGRGLQQMFDQLAAQSFGFPLPAERAAHAA